MNLGETNWWQEGQGELPRQVWAFTCDAPLVSMHVCAEAGDVFLADGAGGIYRLNEAGRLITLTRSGIELTHLDWSEDGEAGVVVHGGSTLSWLDSKLKVKWSKSFQEPILSAAINPQGSHVLVALRDGQNVILNAAQKRERKFSTMQAINHIVWLATSAEWMALADHGFIARYRWPSNQLWHERLLSRIDSMAATYDGSCIVLAALSHGIQLYDSEGRRQSAYVVEGAVHRVSISCDGRLLAAATIEGHLLMLHESGRFLWQASAPERVQSLHLSPWGDALYVGFAEGRLAKLIHAHSGRERKS